MGKQAGSSSGWQLRQQSSRKQAVAARRCPLPGGPTCQPAHAQRLFHLRTAARGRRHSPPQLPGAVAAAVHIAVAACEARAGKRGAAAGGML